MSMHLRYTRSYKLLAVFLTVLSMAVLAAFPVRAAGTGWYTPRAGNHRQPAFGPDLRAVEKYGGYYMDYHHTAPDAADKVVYLTFDAGYENGNVERVLDALAAEDAPGAFFVLGHLAERNPALLRRMTAEGHLVCNHTYTHRNLCGASSEAVERELCRLEQACLEAGVPVAKYFRPPEGSLDEGLLASVQKLGYKTVFWSFAYADWDNRRQPDPVAAKKKILDNVHNGAVLLLHPTSATNAEILPDLLRTLKAEGYRFGTLDELTGGD